MRQAEFKVKTKCIYYFKLGAVKVSVWYGFLNMGDLSWLKLKDLGIISRVGALDRGQMGF